MVQSVKDVTQSLVDDNLVDSEKIGTSVYFWAFPSKAAAVRKRKLRESDDQAEDAAKRLRMVEDNVAEARKGREDGPDRDKATLIT